MHHFKLVFIHSFSHSLLIGFIAIVFTVSHCSVFRTLSLFLLHTNSTNRMSCVKWMCKSAKFWLQMFHKPFNGYGCWWKIYCSSEEKVYNKTKNKNEEIKHENNHQISKWRWFVGYNRSVNSIDVSFIQIFRWWNSLLAKCCFDQYRLIRVAALNSPIQFTNNIFECVCLTRKLTKTIFTSNKSHTPFIDSTNLWFYWFTRSYEKKKMNVHFHKCPDAFRVFERVLLE